MDIDAEIYKMNIQGFPPFNDKMTFYYDETGNCRKFTLTEKGFNDSNAVYKNFILGGIAFGDSPDENIMAQLYSSLGFVEGEQSELKFKNLYHKSKDFLNFIESQRVSEFLSWLDGSGVYIHFLTLNNLYYSLADIVDSLGSEIISRCNRELKNALFNYVVANTNEIIQVLYQHKYPNITDVPQFVDDLVGLIKKKNISYFLGVICDELIKAKKNNELVFIQNNAPYILIEEYYQFYLNRICIFSESENHFDEEPNIQKQLKNVVLHDNNKILKNYHFIKSAECKYIQISDMLVGLLGKLFVFLDDHNKDEIIKIANAINETQARNFSTIFKLFIRSNNKSPFLICNINSNRSIIDREKKLKILAHIIE
ncbi:MAG: DUF3800 domain-containing protein [Hominimerdicola sp.]